MDLSLCLIVKDETRFLSECVASVRDLVNQVVIVDTGSTDGTVEQARAMADEFAEASFGGDFSAARNAALDRADGDWVLFLDADERVPTAAHQAVLRIVSESPRDVLGHRLLRYNFFANGTFYTGRELRLFRNLPEIRYRRRINESVSGAIADLGGQVVPAPALMNHVGHCRPVAERERKAHRYLNLMAEQLRDRGDDPILTGYIGLIERTLGKFDAALRHSLEATEIGPGNPTVWMFRGHVLRSVGDDLGALAAYRHASKLAPDSAAAQNMIGVQMQVTDELTEAEDAFGLARKLDPLLVHVDINLGLVAQARQQWDTAVALFERAARANPAFLDDHWHGRLERDPYRSFYNETVFGYAGLGYHLGYCRLRADGES